MRRMTTLPEYVLTMSRQYADRRFVRGQLKKRWFNVAERTSDSRLFAEAWVDCSGMTEAETVAAVLHDLRLAVLDQLE